MEGILVTFTVLIIIGVVLEVSFFSDGYAQRLHDRTIYVITNQSSSLRNISQILVGDMPSAIGVDSDTHTVYVANSGSDSISVISGINYTKIGEDIPVGDNPQGIDVDSRTHTVYVANRASDSISVISGINYTKIGEDIPFGDRPEAIGVENSLYLASNHGDYLSVIDRENYEKISEDIPVGERPSAIGIHLDKIFVTNYAADSISVISQKNNSEINISKAS